MMASQIPPGKTFELSIFWYRWIWEKWCHQTHGCEREASFLKKQTIPPRRDVRIRQVRSLMSAHDRAFADDEAHCHAIGIGDRQRITFLSESLTGEFSFIMGKSAIHNSLRIRQSEPGDHVPALPVATNCGLTHKRGLSIITNQ